MKKYKSFGALARKLAKVAAELPVTYADSMQISATLVKSKAKESIGHYQDGWEKLAVSTVLDKLDSGYAAVALPGGDGGDNPLLRTGAMRDSITDESNALEFIVGSPSEILVYQETGTSRIPPRPVLAPALYKSVPEILQITGAAIEKRLAGES